MCTAGACDEHPCAGAQRLCCVLRLDVSVGELLAMRRALQEHRVASMCIGMSKNIE